MEREERRCYDCSLPPPASSLDSMPEMAAAFPHFCSIHCCRQGKGREEWRHRAPATQRSQGVDAVDSLLLRGRRRKVVRRDAVDLRARARVSLDASASSAHRHVSFAGRERKRCERGGEEK